MVALTGELGPPPDRILDLWGLDALRGIAVDGDAVSLGALTTYTDIRRSAVCREHLPVLVEAAATIGAAQIQNRGTIGGNVANASPAGDTLPVLLAAGASFVVGSVRGERTIRADAFWPAYRQTALAPDELLLRIRIPLLAGREMRFRKVGTRRAQSISKVVIALGWRDAGPAAPWSRCPPGPRVRGGHPDPCRRHESLRRPPADPGNGRPSGRGARRRAPPRSTTSARRPSTAASSRRESSTGSSARRVAGDAASPGRRRGRRPRAASLIDRLDVIAPGASPRSRRCSRARAASSGASGGGSADRLGRGDVRERPRHRAGDAQGRRADRVARGPPPTRRSAGDGLRPLVRRTGL